MILLIFLFHLIFYSENIYATSEFQQTYRGARSKAMGGIATGLADDEQALYFNPAGLAGVESNTIRLMSLDIESSRDILDAYTAFQGKTSGTSLSALNALMGKNVYSRVQLSPSFVMSHFGLGLISDYQSALYMENVAMPNVTLGYQITHGVQMGAGFNVLHCCNQRSEFRVGGGSKRALETWWVF